MQLTRDQMIAFDKAAFLCSRSEHCTSEIQDKLRQWGLSQGDMEAVTEKLHADKYIDDERFARAYVKDKSRFNKWGRQKISFMLRNKKIASEIIRLACEEIEDESYANQLQKLLTDKAKTIKSGSKFERRNKLMRFAIGRGFEPAQISAVLKEMDLPDDEDFEK